MYEQVLIIVSGTGSAGLKGTITDSITGNPVVGAILTLLPTGKTAVTDEEGKYHFTQLAAQDYEVSIAAEGYQSLEANQTISTGTTSTLNARWWQSDKILEQPIKKGTSERCHFLCCLIPLLHF